MTKALHLAAAAALCAASPTFAQTAAGGSAGWASSAQVGAASDYLFRGVDQTRGRGEGFGSVEVDGTSAHFGAWASNVTVPGAHGATAREEVDLYGGWLTSVEGFDLDAGAIGYLFTGDRGRPDLMELYARLARTLGPARLSLSGHYGALGEDGAHDGYLELKARYPITPRLSVSGAAGHLYENRPGVLDAFEAEAPRLSFNDTVWNAGLTYRLTDRIGLDLRWSDADHRAAGYPSRVFATVRAKVF